MPQGKTYVKIASTSLASAGTITFSNIPQNFTDLVLIVDNIKSSTGTPGIALRLNSDSSALYSTTILEGNGSTAGSVRRGPNGLFFNFGGATVGFNNTTGSIAIFNLMNYSNTSIFKTVSNKFTSGLNSASGVSIAVGTYRSTSSITSLTVMDEGASNLASGATAVLYGIECAKTPYATGGDKIYSTGTYWVHEFYNSGLFVPRQNLTADYLVVAGGGGAGTGNSGAGGGGGGAGGLRSTVTATGGGGSLESALSLNASTAYVVTIGGGGIGGSSPTNGSNSVFSTITSTGGGYGGGVGNSGGSGGGGGGNDALAGGSGTANQGYAGGASYNGTGTGAGGGGGASAVGTAGGIGNSLNGGAGGAGVTTSISGSSITYAGGGGGSSASSGGSGGAGGSGGGGAGATVNANGTSGTTNSGGGGGGARAGAGYTPGSGGSGIVIVRYPI